MQTDLSFSMSNINGPKACGRYERDVRRWMLGNKNPELLHQFGIFVIFVN